jgi:hypothetical protein
MPTFCGSCKLVFLFGHVVDFFTDVVGELSAFEVARERLELHLDLGLSLLLSFEVLLV